MDAYSSTRPATQSIPHTEAELCINAWYYVDTGGVVMRLAAKAYALRGSDAEKLATLRQTAETDHLTATWDKVPSNYNLGLADGTLQGATTQAHIQQDPITIFDNLFSKIEKDLPDIFISVNQEYQRKRLKLEEPFLWVCTPVFEREDGTLLAQVS